MTAITVIIGFIWKQVYVSYQIKALVAMWSNVSNSEFGLRSHLFKGIPIVMISLKYLDVEWLQVIAKNWK